MVRLIFLTVFMISIRAHAGESTVHQVNAMDLQSLTWRNHNAAEAIFADEDRQTAKSGPKPAPTPSAQKSLIGSHEMIVSISRSQRYLFLKAAGSIVRFHVDGSLSDRDLDRIAGDLRHACVRTRGAITGCAQAGKPVLEIDRLFFANVRDLQLDHWPLRGPPQDPIWTLSCATKGCLHNGKAPTLAVSSRPTSGEILAKGFDSQRVRNSRAPASVIPTRLDKVFVTREGSRGE